MNITFDDVMGLLGNAVDIGGDLIHYHKNCEAMKSLNTMLIARRLGATEERYSHQINIHNTILAIKASLNPPPPQYDFQNMLSQYGLTMNYTIDPALEQIYSYTSELRRLTDNIFIYVAMKYSEKGVEWVLNKFGDDVKKGYYATIR